MFSCGCSEERKEMIPGVDVTPLNLCHGNHPSLIKKGNLKSVSCLVKKIFIHLTKIFSENEIFPGTILINLMMTSSLFGSVYSVEI